MVTCVSVPAIFHEENMKNDSGIQTVSTYIKYEGPTYPRQLQRLLAPGPNLTHVPFYSKGDPWVLGWNAFQRKGRFGGPTPESVEEL